MTIDDAFERRLSRRALLRTATAIGMTIPAIGLLTACGDDDDDEPTGPEPGEPQRPLHPRRRAAARSGSR